METLGGGIVRFISEQDPTEIQGRIHYPQLYILGHFRPGDLSLSSRISRGAGTAFLRLEISPGSPPGGRGINTMAPSRVPFTGRCSRTFLAGSVGRAFTPFRQQPMGRDWLRGGNGFDTVKSIPAP